MISQLLLGAGAFLIGRSMAESSPATIKSATDAALAVRVEQPFDPYFSAGTGPDSLYRSVAQWVFDPFSQYNALSLVDQTNAMALAAVASVEGRKTAILTIGSEAGGVPEYLLGYIILLAVEQEVPVSILVPVAE